MALGEVRKIGLDADELKASIDASVVRVQLEARAVPRRICPSLVEMLRQMNAAAGRRTEHVRSRNNPSSSKYLSTEKLHIESSREEAASRGCNDAFV